jgi:Zn-dependent protease with chaperone function
MPRLFLIAGAVLMGVGVLLWAGVPLGKLPGDFMFRRGPISFYVPLASSIVISIVLTLLMMFFRR